MFCFASRWGVMRFADIDPALKHCQAEIDEAAKAGDTEKLKAIIAREGLPWLDPALDKKGTSCDDHQTKPPDQRPPPIA